jgi:hypothetical protein
MPEFTRILPGVGLAGASASVGESLARIAREARREQDQVIEIPGFQAREAGENRRRRRIGNDSGISGAPVRRSLDISVHDMFSSIVKQLERGVVWH